MNKRLPQLAQDAVFSEVNTKPISYVWAECRDFNIKLLGYTVNTRM